MLQITKLYTIRRFLLATSVLDFITPSLADRFLDSNGSAEILTYLINEQLFITTIEETNQIYRYHQLFRDFLLVRLGSEKIQLYKKAAEIVRQNRQLGRAIEYYGSAGCTNEQITLINEAGMEELRNGQWQTVLRWLTQIPDTEIKKNPRLSFYQATIEVYQGRTSEAEPLIKSAISGFQSTNDQTGLIESKILKARILNTHGQYQSALNELEEVYALIPPEEICKRFYLPLEKSLCLVKLGYLSKAETVLTEALELVKKETNPLQKVYIVEGLASVFYVKGDYSKSLQMLRLADKIVSDRVKTGYYIQDSIVGIYNDWGETERAMEYAKRNVTTKERFGLTETLPSAYLFLGSTYLSRSEINFAEVYFKKAVNLLEENGGDRYLLILIRDFLAWSKCISGHWTEARALIEENLAMAYQTGGLIVYCTLMYQGIILASSGSFLEAIPTLTKAADYLEQSGCLIPLCYTYKTLAWSLFEKQDYELAGAIAQKYLELAAKVNLLDGFLQSTYDFLIPIFRYGMENDIEVTYIQRVVVRAGDLFLSLLEELANHTNSKVRQRTVIPLAEIGGAVPHRILEIMSRDSDITVRQTSPYQFKWKKQFAHQRNN